MILQFDGFFSEMLARGGTFDITGTTAVEDKLLWGYNITDNAVIESIKGVAVKSEVTTLAEIRSAEVDISPLILTGASDQLFGNVIYRAAGYIITSIKLTSGKLHGYKLINQITT
jgi:hypothetical protein